MTLTSHPQRVIPLQGAINFRDLGGYKTQSGQLIKWQKIYRGASLNRLTAADLALLYQLKISHDLDLRSPAEQLSAPDKAWDNCQFVAVPLYPTKHFERLFSHCQQERVTPRPHQQPQLDNPIAQIYQNVILTPQSQHSLAIVFKTLLTLPNRDALVFHCSAGKDRTGITAALILMALDVPATTIIKDYLLTNELYQFAPADAHTTNDRLQQIVQQLNTKTGDACFIQGVIQTITKGYGGFTNYWHDALKLSLTDLTDLHHYYLT